TGEGGTHIAGFRRALTRTLKKYADDSGMRKKLERAKIEINGDDFSERLTAIISRKAQESQYEGQTKSKLVSTEVMGIVDQMVGEMLRNFLEENPRDAKEIVNKVVLAATARHAARKARELVQRKNIFTSSGLPGKLSDCSSKNSEECELYIVEG